MSDNAARRLRFYLDDMIGFAQKVIAYTDGLDQARREAEEGLKLKVMEKDQTIASKPSSKRFPPCRKTSTRNARPS